jgi:hypothetical protein
MRQTTKRVATPALSTTGIEPAISSSPAESNGFDFNFNDGFYESPKTGAVEAVQTKSQSKERATDWIRALADRVDQGNVPLALTNALITLKQLWDRLPNVEQSITLTRIN